MAAMTPEQEKIVERFSTNHPHPGCDLTALQAAVAALLAERGDLLAFKAVHGSEACAMERRAGNGPCGACRLCVLDAEAERDAALAAMNRANDLITLTENERDAALAEREELKRKDEFNTGSRSLPRGLALEHSRLDVMWQKLVGERDAALAKLGAVSELLAECREVLNNYPRSLGYDITHVRKIDAALASTPEPEIVAVVDGYLEAGARYETAEDFGDGGFCSRSGYQNDEVPVRAIIVKAEHPEPSPCSDPKKP